MKWRKHDDSALVSDCGFYSVTRIGYQNESGQKGGFYEAWRRRAHPDGPHLIASNLATSAEARHLCERDDAEN